LSQDAETIATLRAGPPSLVGRNIGPFHLTRTLGEGGMGVVYLAEQRVPIERQVAIKVIKLGLDSHEIAGRFEAERQSLALMNHPGIARVIDAGATAEGWPYFVMEYVEGPTLTRYCEEQRLDGAARLELFVRVCEAVQHAHQKGVIHRDLKPSNILVATVDGRAQPKVIDFGVAKVTGQRSAEHTAYTRLGFIVGTPGYMSPEQADRGDLDLDTTTDIYSLGVVLYELLVGVPPFDPDALRRAGYSEMQRLIRESEPTIPSRRLREQDEAGSTLVGMGRLGEAEGHLTASYRALLAAFGPLHRRTTSAAGQLAALYEARGLPEEAARYRRLAGPGSASPPPRP
jgi:eukaryotic-like serine/threonine-protein kinase